MKKFFIYIPVLLLLSSVTSVTSFAEENTSTENSTIENSTTIETTTTSSMNEETETTVTSSTGEELVEYAEVTPTTVLVKQGEVLTVERVQEDAGYHGAGFKGKSLRLAHWVNRKFALNLWRCH